MESLYQLIYFRYLILQVNVNWPNYKLHVDINIQHNLSWMYIFIRLVRIDVMQLSYLHCLQHSLRWMYIFRRLTWIDINVVNLITLHVLIMLHNSCLSISCYTIFIAITRYLLQGALDLLVLLFYNSRTLDPLLFIICKRKRSRQ